MPRIRAIRYVALPCLAKIGRNQRPPLEQRRRQDNQNLQGYFTRVRDRASVERCWMSGEHASPQRLDALLTRAALTRPQREAVIFQDIVWTYAEVHDRACRLAGVLAGLGVRK